MKRHVLLCAAGFTLFAGTVTAQSATFSQIDLDGDGTLTLEEFAAFYGARSAATAMRQYDADGDGFVTETEITDKQDIAGFENSSAGKATAYANQQRAAENRANAPGRNRDSAETEDEGEGTTTRARGRSGEKSNNGNRGGGNGRGNGRNGD